MRKSRVRNAKKHILKNENLDKDFLLDKIKQTSFLPDIDADYCPMCHRNPIHKKIRIVSLGMTIKNPNGSYYFKKTGEEERIETWVSCKECVARLDTWEYNQKVIEIYNNKI